MAFRARSIWKKEHGREAAVTTVDEISRTAVADSLLPSATPLQLIDPDGRPGENPGELPLPEPAILLELYRRMVLGRRFDRQATTLTRQGRLAVYPSSRGQDACQVGAVAALRDQDWLFPTYRDTVAIVTRGVDPVEALDAAARRLALRLRPLPVPRRAAVHPAGHQHPARRRASPRRPAQAAGRGGAGAARRRRDQRGRHPRGAQLRRGVEGTGGVPGAEQRLRDQRAAGQADRRPDPGRPRASATASPHC